MKIDAKHNKYLLWVIGDTDVSTESEYDRQMAKRTFNQMNKLFGQIDPVTDKMEKGEGSFYLQNIIFNLNLRLGLTTVSKEVFLESMLSMYDMGQDVKKQLTKKDELGSNDETIDGIELDDEIQKTIHNR